MLGRFFVTEIDMAQVVQQTKVCKLAAYFPSNRRGCRTGAHQSLLIQIVVEDFEHQRQANSVSCSPTKRAERLNEAIHRGWSLRRGDVAATHEGDAAGAQLPGLFETAQHGFDR